MGSSQLTLVDASSEADPLQAFPPETDIPPRLRRWSRSRGFVEVPVPPLFRATIDAGTIRKRWSGFYRRMARRVRVGRFPYVFVLGMAVGALAVGMTGARPERAVPRQVGALPSTSTSGSGLELGSVAALGTAGVEQAAPVTTGSAVGETPRARPESKRSRPEPTRSRLAASGVRPVRNLAASVRPAGHLGTLRVDSTPSGADVFLNGSLAGHTPLVLRNLPVGSRAVRVSLDGYAGWSRGVTVVADQATAVSARLDRKQ